MGTPVACVGLRCPGRLSQAVPGGSMGRGVAPGAPCRGVRRRLPAWRTAWATLRPGVVRLLSAGGLRWARARWRHRSGSSVPGRPGGARPDRPGGRWDARAAPPALVLAAHGITANALSWQPVADEVSRRSGPTAVRFLAPDLRGRAGSRELQGPWGLGAHVDDLMAVADAAGAERVVLLGHSMGAFIAALAAARTPPGSAPRSWSTVAWRSPRRPEPTSTPCCTR